MEINKIGVHHFGGDYSFSHINRSHRNRWPEFPSRLNHHWWIGYTIVILTSGKWIQTRYFGEETASVRGSNLNVIHIALQGNFDASKPTYAQVTTLRKLLTAITRNDLSEFKVLAGTTVKIEHVLPHRRFPNAQTSYYGKVLTDTWARSLYGGEPLQPSSEISRLQKMIELLMLQIQLLLRQKLGGEEGCGEMRG